MALNRKIYGICRICLFLTTISAAVLIIGGADGFARERFIYEVTAKNNQSHVNTTLQVYAPDERAARENVMLNGWQVLSVKQITYRVVEAVPVRVGDAPVVYVTIGGQSANADKSRLSAGESGGGRVSDEELINSILGAPVPDTFTGLEPSAGHSSHVQAQSVAMAALMPGSDQFVRLLTFYFDPGSVEPRITEADRMALAAFGKDEIYYLFGHTDDLPVVKNSPFRDNYELSFMRAEAVKALLTSYGINPANINTVGFGSLYPAVENTPGPDGTRQNRRVEIYGHRQTE